MNKATVKNNQTEAAEPSSQKGSKDLAFYLIIFILAIAKDLLEFVFGLIPFLNFLVIAISLIFSISITLALVLFGKFGFWKMAGFLLAQLADCIPILTVLPLTTITLILMLLLEKTPVSKISQPATKIIKKFS